MGRNATSFLIFMAVSFVACAAFPQTSTKNPTQSIPEIGAKPVELSGLHNVIRVSEKLYSGSSPDDVPAFESLKSLDIKTILSVDGARPDVETAKTFAMRYVHLPIGYDGISQEQALQLAKAVRDLPGPIYLHCHHGKHRSPGAAAAIQICLDNKCTAAQAIEIMKRAGTDPRYVGLLNGPNVLRRPTTKELNQLVVEFHEVADIPALARAMVEVDKHWDYLMLIRKSDWKSPLKHPDLDPPHEALQLREQYRELARTPDTQKRPADFKTLLASSEQAASDLETAMREHSTKPDADKVEKAFVRTRMLCAQCHDKYRDVPKNK
jgi:protein tyrosine phosphatase (PTP) superfamily phosphohydrolase (DUF442 family)